LFRFVQGIGVKPVLWGNIKGLQDPYRNPTTQRGFADKWGQNVRMVTSFADGTKVAYEQAVVANATDMRVAKRGMIGPDPTNMDPTQPLRNLEEYLPMFEPYLDPDKPGIVDFVVGARPGPGIFVIGRHDHPRQQHYLNLYKLGAGPYYLFYTPWHLCHFEVPNTVARAALFHDAHDRPAGRPARGGGRASQERLGRGRDPGRDRGVCELWRGRELPPILPRAAFADGPVRRVPIEARDQKGSGHHDGRRRNSGRAHHRPSVCGAGSDAWRGQSERGVKFYRVLASSFFIAMATLRAAWRAQSDSVY
jgi:hypothetical protein